MENTRFAKKVFRLYHDELFPLWRECVSTAESDNEMARGTAENSMWFIHHLAMVVNILHFSGEPVFPYDSSRDELVKQMHLFALRGMGMTDDAIRKYYRLPDLQKNF